MAACRLLIFVKAPTPGRVKTRCLPLLSPLEAAQLYQRLVRDTLRVVTELGRAVRPIVAYAADERFPDLRWLEVDVPMMLQEGATLGERLTRAFAQAFAQHPTPVIALGSDAPELTADWICEAVAALSRHDVVVGPTHDGGYHLIGLTRQQPALFHNMPWSQPGLLSATLAEAARLGLSYHCLDLIHDLDTPEDLQRYLARIDEATPTATAQYLQRFRHPKLLHA